MGKINDFLNSFFGWETYAQRQERLYQKYKKKHPSQQSVEADPVILSDVENSFEHKVEPAKLPIERNFSCADKEIRKSILIYPETFFRSTVIVS